MGGIGSTRTWIVILGMAVACAHAAQAAAQQPSLAEVARKEQQRRARIGETKKVLTNEDLPRVVAPARPAPPTDVPEAPSADSQPDQQAGEPAQEQPAESAEAASSEPQQNEAWWRSRLQQANEALRRAEMFAEALQSRINALTTDFANRDDPAQRAVIEAERTRALAELERVRKEIGQHQKELAQIEEEARRAGVPPGWLR